MRSFEKGSQRFSVVGLGGYEFEDDPSWPGARDVVTVAAVSGIDWIDTAEEYFSGGSERTIAAALADTGVTMKIASKVAPKPDGTGFSPAGVREACATSLGRLKRDRLDIYFLHYPDDEAEAPLEDTWAAMRALADDGLVGLVGLSNFTKADVERCLAIGPVDILQEGLSPIDHLRTLELAAWCGERGIAMVTYEPFGGGMLAGTIDAPEDFARLVGDDYTEWPFWQRLFAPGKFERSAAVRDRMLAVAEQVGCTLPQLALAWNLAQDGVDATLAGTRNPDDVRSNAEAADVVLTTDQLALLEDMLPLGPTYG